MPNKSETTSELFAEVSKLAFEITTNSDNETIVFLRFYAHVQHIEVEIYKNGWRGGKTSGNEFYFDRTDVRENLRKTIKELKKYVEVKKDAKSRKLEHSSRNK